MDIIPPSLKKELSDEGIIMLNNALTSISDDKKARSLAVAATRAEIESSIIESHKVAAPMPRISETEAEAILRRVNATLEASKDTVKGNCLFMLPSVVAINLQDQLSTNFN